MDKKKMKLKLNSLKVKSFVTGDQADKVKAGVNPTAGTNCFISCVEPCGTDPVQTEAATCPNTCAMSCAATCIASCNGTCDTECFLTMPPVCQSAVRQYMC